MIKLWQITRAHIAEDFNVKRYTLLALFLAAFIALNFSIQLENEVIDERQFQYLRIVWYFLLYAVGYYFTCWLVSLHQKNNGFWSDKKFWILSVLGLVVLSLDIGFPYTTYLIRYASDHYSVYLWLHQVMDHASGFLWVTLLLFIIYNIIDRKPSNFYGLSYNAGIKSYAALLLIMIPLIAIATINKDFIQYYPMYKTTDVHTIFEWPRWLPPAIYELVYGASFINVELLFRGFFVIGMSQVLGKQAILPMVTIYCFLHFGKPLGECVSSIFGGYVLGILAYRTKSIWGGIFIHICIAWLMEAAAYLVKQLATS